MKEEEESPGEPEPESVSEALKEEEESPGEPEPESVSEALEKEEESLGEPEPESVSEALEKKEETLEAAALQSAGCIISLLNIEYLQNIPKVTLIQNTVQNCDALLQVILELQTVTAVAQYPDGTIETLRLCVKWNVGNLEETQIDVSVPGRYEERGQIVLPEGYIFAEGVLQEIRIPVEVIIPDQTVMLTGMDEYPLLADAYAFSLGTDITEIRQSCAPASYWNCYDAEGQLYVAKLCWDYSHIDTQRPGVYEVTGQLLLPEHTAFAQTLPVDCFTFPVSIQEPGRPEINCCFAGRGRFVFPWIASAVTLDQITVWISEENGSWESYTEQTSHLYWDEFQLILDAALFTPGKRYRLQVDYGSGATSILSFTYDQLLHITSYNEGDRDGGDVNGFPPDKVPILPEDTPASTESEAATESEPKQPQPGEKEPETGLFSGKTEKQQAAASPDTSDDDTGVLESSGEDYDLISGKRLMMLLRFSETVSFSKQGILVFLSGDTVRLADPAEKDRFCIQISRSSARSFSFSVTKNGRYISNLKNTKLLIPWSFDTGASAFLLLNEETGAVSVGTYSKEENILSFSVDAGGDYRICTLPGVADLFAVIPRVVLFLVCQRLV